MRQSNILGVISPRDNNKNDAAPFYIMAENGNSLSNGILED